MSGWTCPRAWSDPSGCSSTKVLWDPCHRVPNCAAPEGGSVYMHTNLGWVGPVELDLAEGETPEQAAQKIAEGYELEEVDRERAIWLAGFEGQEDSFK